LKHLPEHGLEFVHDTEEAGVEVSDGGSGESGEHGGVDRTGAGSHEKTLRGLNTGSDHGSPEKWGPGVISGRIGVEWGGYWRMLCGMHSGGNAGRAPGRWRWWLECEGGGFSPTSWKSPAMHWEGVRAEVIFPETVLWGILEGEHRS
jgi:hypothetical protein